jgi:hypothetical protein
MLRAGEGNGLRWRRTLGDPTCAREARRARVVPTEQRSRTAAAGVHPDVRALVVP